MAGRAIRQKLTRLLPLPILLLLTAAATVQAELNSYQAHYTLSSFYMTQANATTTLRIDNQIRYHITSEVKPASWIGIINHSERFEQSSGLIEKQRLLPEDYHYLHADWVGDKREIQINIDHQKNKISNHHRHINNKWSMDSVDGVQDRLSSLLSLMLYLQTSKADGSSQSFSFPIADGGRIKHYYFQIEQEEPLDTPIGTLKTIRVKHWRSNQQGWIIIWCAEELAYLPVKLLHQHPHMPDYVSLISDYKKLP